MKEEKKRLDYIDFLKFIGLSCIILAHVNPPEWLMIRNFDVPLMVLVSSFLGSKSVQKYNGFSGTMKYYQSRLIRLVVPTWIFLSVYFLFRYFLFGEVNELKYYILSFLMTRYGVGYVWVILVYVYVSVLMVLFKKINKYRWMVAVIGLIYIAYEIVYKMGFANSSILVQSTLFTIVPYGAVAYIGYKYGELSKRARIILCAVCGVIFAGLTVYYRLTLGGFVNVQAYKYPPRIYYLVFGVFISLILFWVSGKLPKKLLNNCVIKFISVHSLSIYLCHAFFIDLYDKLLLPQRWYLRYVAVYLITLGFIFVSYKLITLIKKLFEKKQQKRFD